MQLKNYYWYFQKAVPEKICDEIVRYAKSIRDQMAVTGDFKEPQTLDEIKDLKKKRDSNLIFIKQIRMRIGIFSGIVVNIVSLPNIVKDNIMTGIVMDGVNLIKKKGIFVTEKLESCPLHYLYRMKKIIKVGT